MIGELKRDKENSDSGSEFDSDAENSLINKVGLLIEKKFANIVIEGGNKPRKITRTDQVLNYSQIIRDQEERENIRRRLQSEKEKKKTERYLKKLEKERQGLVYQ